MKNFITNKLPYTLLDLPIHTDFKRWIVIEQMMQNPLNMTYALIEDVINLIFIKEKPTDLELAFSEIMSFMNMYQEHTEEVDLTQEPLFDWEQDDTKVWSAFMRAYGINLRTTDMHIWEFKSLMLDLPSDCLLETAKYYRKQKLSDLEGKQREEMAKAKRYFEIK